MQEINIKGYKIMFDRLTRVSIYRGSSLLIEYEAEDVPCKILVLCDSEQEAKEEIFGILKRMVTEESSSEEL